MGCRPLPKREEHKKQQLDNNGSTMDDFWLRVSLTLESRLYASCCKFVRCYVVNIEQ